MKGSQSTAFPDKASICPGGREASAAQPVQPLTVYVQVPAAQCTLLWLLKGFVPTPSRIAGCPKMLLLEWDSLQQT